MRYASVGTIKHTHKVDLCVCSQLEWKAMTKQREDTTVRISGPRRLKLERKAIETSMKCGRIIKMSDIVNWLLDNRLEEATSAIEREYREKENPQ